MFAARHLGTSTFRLYLHNSQIESLIIRYLPPFFTVRIYLRLYPIISKSMQPRFVSWAAVSSLPQAKKISVDDQLETNKEHVDQWGGLLVEEIAIRGKTRSI